MGAGWETGAGRESPWNKRQQPKPARRTVRSPTPKMRRGTERRYFFDEDRKPTAGIADEGAGGLWVAVRKPPVAEVDTELILDAEDPFVAGGVSEDRVVVLRAG